MLANKSVEQQPQITPGEYEGLQTAYYLRIQFENGKYSEPIKMLGGVRGFDCSMKVTVDQNGWVIAK
jgi:hypothetical protein